MRIPPFYDGYILLSAEMSEMLLTSKFVTSTDSIHRDGERSGPAKYRDELCLTVGTFFAFRSMTPFSMLSSHVPILFVNAFSFFFMGKR
jgi:hypothetical protein